MQQSFFHKGIRQQIFFLKKSQGWTPASLEKTCIIADHNFWVFFFCSTSHKVREKFTIQCKDLLFCPDPFEIKLLAWCPINFRVFLQRHFPAKPQYNHQSQKLSMIHHYHLILSPQPSFTKCPVSFWRVPITLWVLPCFLARDSQARLVLLVPQA